MKNLEQSTLEYLLAHEERSFKGSEIAKEVGAHPDVMHTLLMRWTSSGILGKEGKKFHIKAKPLEGKLSVNRAGEGFVTVEGYEDDFFISPSRLSTGMNRDRVMIIPFGGAKRSGRRLEAGVISVLERSAKRLVGTFERRGSESFVTPDDTRFRRTLEIPDEHANHAKNGQKVVVDLLEWNDPAENPKGTILEIIGFPGEKGVDVLSAAKQHDIHFDFPHMVEADCAAIPKEIPEKEILRRLDFRHGNVFTIDPYDAKDFDDAISIDHKNGNVILGVHIADVSHYVIEKTNLDKEAYTRGTSTYLVDRVIPMLPEVLSNGLCSLRPHEDKLTFSCFMEIDGQGNVCDYDIVETVIHSQRRFTYEEAQEIIGGKNLENTSDIMLNAVREAYAMSKRLMKKRMSDGSIDFDTAETKFVLDDDGKPVSCFRKDRLDAHRLIEECMLLANQTVCRHIGEGKNPPPYLYRVHDKPVKEKFENFLNLLKSLGHDVHGFRDMANITPKKVQGLIESVHGSDHSGLVDKVAIRSMAKAAYSEKNLGHFGLAFEYYTHFTSPIRRYPDLIVHRLLKEYASGMSPERQGFWDAFLPKASRHCSDREKIATEAERDSIKVKQAEFMEQYIGEEFDGIVSGVVGFGLFIEIQQFLIEGFVHVKDLPGDYFVFDEKSYRMLGRRTKKTYRLGDPARIRVARVNREKHEMDFELVV